VGASVVAGYGVSPAAAFPKQLENLPRAQGYDVNVSNAGISGGTSSGMLRRLDSAVPSGTQLVLLGLRQ
jgi:acyl-CoA thioesterase-1